MAGEIQFPPEIIEKILNFCDFRTLRVAREVNSNWLQYCNQIIQKRINFDIKEETYDQILTKWQFRLNRLDIYDNWKCWESIQNNIKFKTKLICSQIEEPEKYQDAITCITCSGTHIAVSREASYVDIYNTNAIFLTQFIYLVDIISIYFIRPELELEPTSLLLVCDDCLLLSNLNKRRDNKPFKYHHAYSAHREYICGIRDNMLMIAKVVINEYIDYHVELGIQVDVDLNGYVDTALTSSQCLLLSENNLKIIYYKDDVNFARYIDLTQLQFTIDYGSILGRFRTRIFNGNIIIILYWGLRSDDQILEIYLINDEPLLKPIKWCRPVDVFQEEINAFWLHGNTMVFAFMSGKVLFYEVGDWNSFDFSKYATQIDVNEPIRPINSIEVVERPGKRKFYIAGALGVYTITGKS